MNRVRYMSLCIHEALYFMLFHEKKMHTRKKNRSFLNKLCVTLHIQLFIAYFFASNLFRISIQETPLEYHYKKNKIWKFDLQKTFSELSIASSSSPMSSRPHIQLLHSLFTTIITYYNKTLRDHWPIWKFHFLTWRFN